MPPRSAKPHDTVHDTVPRGVWLVGVDEAGYGPNLGPLVIGLSLWRLGDEAETDAPDAALGARVADAVTRAPAGDDRLVLADSKAVYKPGGGLWPLERGVYASLAAGSGRLPPHWAGLVASLGADAGGHIARAPWRAGADEPLVGDALRAEEIRRAASRLREACERGRVTPPRLAARLVYPEELSDLCDRLGSKGAALSTVTLALLRRAIEQHTLGAAPARVCATLDKHGGRDRYASLVFEAFGDWAPGGLVETLAEGRAESRYRIAGGRVDLRLAFRAKGEASLPVALASMTAKLLRELAMRRFNDFWTGEVPGLRPTAGYPVDARRFRDAIDPRRRAMGIEERLVWRTR